MKFMNVKVTEALIDATYKHVREIEPDTVRDQIVDMYDSLSQTEIDELVTNDWSYLQSFISANQIECE